MVKRTATTHHKKSCRAHRVIITSKDFCYRHAIEKTYVIDAPGKYRLGETIHFKPTSARVAIVIAADNVHLDLCKHELVQDNTTVGVTGIKVLTGHKNVTIVNGSVRKFSKLGIYVEGGQRDIFLGSDASRLIVSECGHGATQSFYDPVTKAAMLQGGIALGESKALATRGYYEYHGKIQTAALCNVLAQENGPVGIYLGVGDDITLVHCSATRNKDTRVAGNTNPLAVGFVTDTTTFVAGLVYSATADLLDESSKSIAIDTCHFDLNASTGLAPVACGAFLAYNIVGLVVRKCTFDTNSGLGADTADAFGVYGLCLGGCTGVLVEDNQAVGNTSEYFSEGFHHTGRNNSLDTPTYTQPSGLVYRRNNATHNSASGSLIYVTAAGFEFDSTVGLTFEDNNAFHNTASTTDTDTCGSAQGLFVFGAQVEGADTRDVVVSRFHAANNSTFTADPTYCDASGVFILGDFSGVIVQNCQLQKNRSTGQGGFDVGVWVSASGDGALNVVVQDNVIEDQVFGIVAKNDSHSIYQGNTIANVMNGILLEEDSECASVTNNYITRATEIGVQDLNVPSASLFANNKVFGADEGFDVVYAFGPLPVVEGSLSLGGGFPPATTSPLDNVFMANPNCNNDEEETRDRRRAVLARGEDAIKARSARKE